MLAPAIHARTRTACQHLQSAKQLSLRVATVSWARLAKAGAPLVGLSDSSVYLLHSGLGCWLRMAGSLSPASAFSSILSSASGAASDFAAHVLSSRG